MQPEQAEALLKALGTQPHTDDEWVRASCPLAPFTHKSGKDSNPSFGIRLEPGERPFFHCFSCLSGSLEDLVGSIELYLTQKPYLAHQFDIKTARTILESADIELVPLPEFSEFGNANQAVFEEWPQWYIESFVQWQFSKPAFEYLKSRGVTGEQAKRFDLRYDSQRQMVVHPYNNVYGKLAGARGRSVQGGKGAKGHYDYTWNGSNNAQLVWYNEPVLATGEPVVVVEGQYDLYAVDRVYPNVVANLTAKPVAAKMSKLAHTPWVILLNDGDETGQIANERYQKYLAGTGTKVTVINYPEEYDSAGNLIKQDPDKMGSDWIETQLSQLGLV